MPRLLPVIFLLFVPLAPIYSQDASPARLTLNRIYESSDFRGESVNFNKWLEGSSYLIWESAVSPKKGNNLVRVDAAGKKEILIEGESLIPPGSKEPLAIHGYELSKDHDLMLIFTNSAKVWRQNTRGDYWIYRKSTGKLTKLGGDAKPSTLMFAKLSPDATKVAYVRENNLYVEPTAGGSPLQLTSDGTDEVINGTFDWVYEEEFYCRDGFRWNPDSKSIAYWQLDTRGVKKFTMIDNTSETYPKLITFAYPKTGERNSACKVGVVSAEGGATKWIDVPGDTKTDYYIPRMDWASSEKELLIQRINRKQKAIDVMLADVAAGTIKTLYTDRDEAWVDVHDDASEWIDGGKEYTWISEQDGWRHLYAISRDGSSFRKITKGDFDVIKVLKVDEKTKSVYFIASPDNPTQKYLYRCTLDGSGTAERVTPAEQPGTHDYNISPDAKIAFHTYSTFSSPPRVEMISLPDHKVLQTLASNDKLREAVSKLAQSPVEFFRADAGNGVKLDGWLMKPPGYDPTKKYPLLFHVYGEPAGQLVNDTWGGSEYLWYLMLNQQGYMVACVDNRGTPCPRGRDWRRSVYRKIGVVASEDQAAAARELLKRPYIDPERVGIWGWSGGGSMTLNMMFRHPEIYKVGMSVAPVPDMRLYDTIYQERYMGLPQDNPEDYKKGSPITHAAGLKGKLLIVHGTGDDNVHYQGTEKLINELVSLKKPFSMMAYPNRTHSISEGKGTSYHLRQMLTQYLYDNLPAGPK